jgi:hypothetical protein
VTLDKARQLLAVQVGFGGGYNRQGARLILADVAREHGADAADRLLAEVDPAGVLGLGPAPRGNRADR